jgi:hypothetical protein
MSDNNKKIALKHASQNGVSFLQARETVKQHTEGMKKTLFDILAELGGSRWKSRNKNKIYYDVVQHSSCSSLNAQHSAIIINLCISDEIARKMFFDV